MRVDVCADYERGGIRHPKYILGVQKLSSKACVYGLSTVRQTHIGANMQACFCDKIFVNQCFENMHVYLSLYILKIISIFDKN